VPKRSNLFQDVVAIIHRHMATGAAVEDPGMLRHKVTGEEREVDVVIRSRVARHEVVVAVEATSTRRPADAGWVEKMLGKHKELPTDKLVLVSEAGFTAQARQIAEDAGAVPLAPMDLAEGDPAYKIVNQLKSIWPKTVSLTPERVRVWVRRPDGKVVWFKASQDLWIFLDDGQEVATLPECVMVFVKSAWPKIMEDIDLANIADDRDEFFKLVIGPWRVRLGSREVTLCARDETAAQGPELHPIEQVEVVGRAVIEVTEVELTHRRLGEVSYAYGESRLGQKPALFVVSEDEAGGQLTLRFRDRSLD